MKRINVTRAIAIMVMMTTAGIAAAQTRVMFWNVENYFDTQDDPQTDDDEFTPAGERHWTPKRFYAKRDAIAKTIIDMGAPAIVGLAEVENRKVLEELCKASPLRQLHYGIIHHDSPDPRGIDCAILYRTELAKPIEELPIRPHYRGHEINTRELLAASFELASGDTLYVVVCHLPSRRLGATSDRQRKTVANRMAQLMDSLSARHPESEVLAMGDFNADTPEVAKLFPPQRFRSLMDQLPTSTGSYNYQGVWQLLDHMIVKPSERSQQWHANVYAPNYLLEEDKRNLCQKPYRTYLGPRYHGGISDHLPIYLDLPTN